MSSNAPTLSPASSFTPATLRHRDGTRIAYSVSPGTSTRTIVLLHGSMQSSRMWQRLGYADGLAQDYRVISLDIRGHGLSDRPITQSSYAMDRLVDDVCAVLDAERVASAAIFGFSLGGRIALNTAVRRPDRCDSLVIASGSHREQRGAMHKVFFPNALEVLENDGIDEFIVQWQNFGRFTLGQASLRSLRDADPRALPAYLRQMDDEPGIDESALRDLDIPTLLMAGTEDPLRHRDCTDVATILPRAYFLELVGRNHARTLFDSTAILPRVTAFLEWARFSDIQNLRMSA